LSWPEFDLVVVGDCNPDLVISGGDVIPEFGQHEKLVDTMSLLIGGSAAITAVAAARLGLRVALVAAIGADPAGDLMLSLLARDRVDTSAVLVRIDQPTGITTVLSAGTDRAILTALGAIGTLTAADVPVALLARARHLHVSSYFLLEDSLGPGLPGLLAAARAGGLTTSLDTNFDPAERWGGARLRAALAQTDVFLPNETEALAISGRAEPAQAAIELTGAASSVVIKLGERGALCLARQHEPVLVTLPPVTPVDTTGAGDCFNAGVIAGLLSGHDLTAAVSIGCAVGAAATTALGGTGAYVDRSAAAELAGTAVITPN
jgi:sugar/nucleoside kinase (ribokinase family)